MIEFMERSSGKAVAIRATGQLSKHDYDAVLIPELERLFAEHGKLDLLFYMDTAFEGWDLGASWEDFSYGLQHRADFGKIAVVGGPAWVAWCVKLSGFLMKGEMRVLPTEALEEAWNWIRT